MYIRDTLIKGVSFEFENRVKELRDKFNQKQ